jgi:hypothetical protein
LNNIAGGHSSTQGEYRETLGSAINRLSETGAPASSTLRPDRGRYVLDTLVSVANTNVTAMLVITQSNV